MHLTTQRQLSIGVSLSSKEKPSAELLQLTERRAGLIFTSQIAEDFANVQKNSGPIRGSKKFRRPRKGWEAVLNRKVPDVIHDW